MADFSIAAQIGQGGAQGGGQNAFAQFANPMNMMQLMQMRQSMDLQRAQEQRAQSAEGRAQATHGLNMDTGRVNLATAQLGLTEQKRKIADLDTSDKAIKFMADNPDWFDKYDSVRKTDSKLWSALTSLAAKKRESDDASKKGRVDYDKARFGLNSDLADLLAATAPVVKDQASYQRWLTPLIQNNQEVAGSLPMEYTPENFAAAKGVVDRLRQFKILRQPTGEDVLVDPINKRIFDFTDQGPQPRAGAVPTAPAAPVVAPAAAPTGGLAPVIESEILRIVPGARITGRGRTPERNAEVGGAATSYHLTNNAIDTAPPAGMPMNQYAALLRRELGPLGYTVIYGDAKHRDHVHIQPGPGMNAPRASMTAQAAPLPGMAQQAPMGQPGAAPGAAPANAMAANPLIAMQMARMMQPQNAMPAAAQPQVGPSGLAAPAPMPVASTNPYAQSPVTQIAGAKAEAEARGKAKVEGEKTEATKEANQQAFDTNLDTVLGAYRDLAQKGYLTTKETPFAERLATGVMANVPVGAATVVNPERGAAYADIANNRQIMLSALMGATGMTAKQIDSNAEMKNWLNALSAPDQEAGSVLRTLNALSKRFGTGRQFTREDMGLPSEGRGKAGETPPRSGKPSFDAFMAKAKPLNPNASDAELKAYYERTYGGR